MNVADPTGRMQDGCVGTRVGHVHRPIDHPHDDDRYTSAHGNLCGVVARARQLTLP